MTQRDARALLAALAGLVLAVCSAPAQAQALASEVVERPEWSVGDWWEGSTQSRDVFRLTVIGKEKTHYVLVATAPGVQGNESASGTKLHADLDGWITKTVRPDGKVTETEYILEWVRFPLGVGNTWSFFVNTETVRGGRGNFSYYCKAEGWETINVGDRSVRALRIRCQQRNRDRRATFTHLAWYAPDVKRVVKLTSDYAGGWAINVTAWGSDPPGKPPTVVSEGPPPTIVGQPAHIRPAVPSPLAAGLEGMGVFP